MSAVIPRGLLALTPGTLEDQLGARRLLDSIAVAFEAGLGAVLLREPRMSDGAFAELAESAVALGANYEERWVGVHDRVHCALSSGAHGVHLGFRSLAPTHARDLVGAQRCVGFSAHAHDLEASWDGADYLTFGPVYATPSKSGVQEPTGLQGLREFVARTALPVFALGGIAPAHVADVLATGAAGIAVLSGIFGAPDSASATRTYVHALQSAAARRP